MCTRKMTRNLSTGGGFNFKLAELTNAATAAWLRIFFQKQKYSGRAPYSVYTIWPLRRLMLSTPTCLLSKAAASSARICANRDSPRTVPRLVTTGWTISTTCDPAGTLSILNYFAGLDFICVSLDRQKHIMSFELYGVYRERGCLLLRGLVHFSLDAEGPPGVVHGGAVRRR
jgi:hypothetical protein